MAIKQGKKLPTIQRFWVIVQNGLFLFGLRNRLASLGIDIDPYYWVQEEVTACAPPMINGNKEEYITRNLGHEDIVHLVKRMPKDISKELMACLKKGQRCFGLEHHGQIAAYMFIEFDQVDYKNKKFDLKNNEAYLFNMWTFNEFRGKKLAPYLRYQCYEMLREMGKDTKFSISQYFNRSSIKFKEKLKTKPLKLYLYIGIFGMFKKHYLIKSYSE